jgi:hypothetical protein
MEVNAALTTLTDHWDLNAAILVVDAFASLPAIRSGQTATLTSTRSRSCEIRGETPEHGHVAIRDRDRTETVQRFGPPDDSVARIGSFTITRVRAFHDPVASIVFRPFQATVYGSSPAPSHSIEYLVDARLPCALYRHEFSRGTPPLGLRLHHFVYSLLHPNGHPELISWVPGKTMMHIVTEDEIDIMIMRRDRESRPE